MEAKSHLISPDISDSNFLINALAIRAGWPQVVAEFELTAPVCDKPWVGEVDPIIVWKMASLSTRNHQHLSPLRQLCEVLWSREDGDKIIYAKLVMMSGPAGQELHLVEQGERFD